MQALLVTTPIYKGAIFIKMLQLTVN